MPKTAGAELRPDEDEQAHDAEQQARFATPGDVMIAQEKRVEDEEPQGSNGDDEGGEADETASSA